MYERDFQSKLKKEIKQLFPGCMVIKLPSSRIQGIPDMLILYKNKWATLENKKSEKEPHRPNQDHYVDLMNHMSFSSFIFPENKDQVLKQLSKFFYS